MKKLARKGFTLLEMIIVLALFSFIMFGVVQFLIPVSKFFVRTSNFETTTACVDNIKRAIEGNLKYADRVRVYAGYDESTIDTNVDAFWEEFFKDRELMDCKGDISVLIFDSTSTHQSGTLGDLNDFNKNQWNSGKISLWTYHFDKTAHSAPVKTEWYVNQKMYGNYNYYYSLGTGTDGFTVGAPTVFNPSDCTISILNREIIRVPGGSSDAFTEDTSVDATNMRNITVASFSMKNVLDATKKYESPTMDYKLVLNPAGDPDYKLSTDGSHIEHMKYVIESVGGAYVEHSRYKPMEVNPGAANPNQYFYFIFTQAETVYDAGERVWGDKGAGAALSIYPITDPGHSFVTPNNPEQDKISVGGVSTPIYDKDYLEQVKNAYASITPP